MIYVIIVFVFINLILWSSIFYRLCFKRIYDVFFSGLAIVVLSPILLILIILGTIKMKGNPFFTQERPGKNEKIFKMVKFRSMRDEYDTLGRLLPGKNRLTPYGRFIRKTSLDELPELINILKGDMSFVGPRPLLVKYLELYNTKQKHRHDVRPGLTGLAQVNGRNSIDWNDRFAMDLSYVQNYSFFGDIKIIFDTFLVVIKKKGIGSSTSEVMEEFFGTDK